MFPPSNSASDKNPDSPDSVFIEQPTAFTNDLAHDDDVTVTNDDANTNTGESLTSLVDLCPAAFARDQPGRQSMSEKRHATLDAKSTDTYQKRKKAREDREKQKQMQNLKKSASLESLNLHSHHMEGHGGHARDLYGGHYNQDLSPYQRANSVRVSRNRGCNESFRAAVDRSYEKDFPEGAVPDSKDYVIKDLTASNTENDKDQTKVVMRRSKSSQNEDRKKNRNSKLLRGLGTMFKIGGSSSNNNQQTQNSIERTKDTKVMRKSMPGPEALTSGSSIASSTTSTASNNHRGQAKSSSDIPHDAYMNQMRLHPHQYVQQQPPRSHSQPRYMTSSRSTNEVYEYMPSSIMRPGSRVGIADPATSDSPDYDVLHRLQNTHIQPQQQPQPQQPQHQQAQHQMRPPPHQIHPQHHQQMYHHYYQSQGQLPPPSGFYNQYGYHQQALPQIAHPRQGSNLSSGSSNNGNNKPPRPKSNYYDYDYSVVNHPAASFASSTASSQYYSSSDHHPSMYSLPRSTSGYP